MEDEKLWNKSVPELFELMKVVMAILEIKLMEGA